MTEPLVIFHCFLELLPELRVVIAQLLDASTLVRLARTCRLLRDETRVIVPKMPDSWSEIWKFMLERNSSAWQLQLVRDAFLELIAFGVPRWPNVEHVFETFAFDDDSYDERGQISCFWLWRDGDDEDITIEYRFCVIRGDAVDDDEETDDGDDDDEEADDDDDNYHYDAGPWRYCHSRVNGDWPKLVLGKLSALPASIVKDWTTFVARDRHGRPEGKEDDNNERGENTVH